MNGQGVAIEPIERLSTADFADYFAALWSPEGGRPVSPFAWQQELLEQAHAERRWPDLIDLPTGTGKTSAIDIAVFLLALGADQPPAEQWHPRRIALVVDRRVIVDQAAERAETIARKLADARSGVLNNVANRLRSLAPGPDGLGPEVPLRQTVLRGGIVRDETWAERPDVPAVLASTVDQVGSRLLFRGYGVSRGMRPIHAGLLSQDVLYLLDEVHLARPFADTLQAVHRYRRIGSRLAELPDRWQVVQLSATVRTSAEWRFPQGELETAGHPVLERRLNASKPVALEAVTTPVDVAKAQQRLANVSAERAVQLVKQGARSVAIIVNRVATASLACAALGRLKANLECDVELITGRMRPVDRDRALARIEPRVKLGRPRHDTDRPLILVSTQSIEAGADFDLDAIVTECASLDALQQRFGRVDRDGLLTEAERQFTSVVLVANRDLNESVVDPVYGVALRRTWAWLSDPGSVDFGIRRLPHPDEAETTRLEPPVLQAPLLLPGHLDRWVRTSDYGVAADPEVAQWLHGINASSVQSDVSVIWRDDLTADLLSRAITDDGIAGSIVGRVNALPPSAREALQVPLASLQRWLRLGAADPALADAWGDHQVDEARGQTDDDRWVVRWRDDRAETIEASRVAPGDVIVVPAALGGLEQGSWSPSSREPVTDVAMSARDAGSVVVVRLSRALDQRVRAAVRAEASGHVLAGTDSAKMEPRTDERVEAVGAAAFPDPDQLDELPPPERREAIEDYLRGLLPHLAGPADAALAARLQTVLDASAWSFQSFAERWVSGQRQASYVLSERVTSAMARRGTATEDDGRDGPSFRQGTAAAVPLKAHLDGVGSWAERLATNLGLSPLAVAAMREAGLGHDLGKLDRRFQLWLHGGDELSRAAQSDELAKSLRATSRSEREQARQRSGYPRGRRHELVSVGLLPAPSNELDDLVRHLIASHHGGGRYRFDPQPDSDVQVISTMIGDRSIEGTTQHELERLDSGLADRFWRLVRTWGWFGLAWLEAVLRLADHEDSRAPESAARAREAQC